MSPKNTIQLIDQIRRVADALHAEVCAPHGSGYCGVGADGHRRDAVIAVRVLNQSPDEPEPAEVPEVLRGVVTDLEGQHVALVDRYNRVIADRSRFERDVMAASRRMAWDQLVSYWNGLYAGLYAGSDDLIEHHVQVLTSLYQRLPDRPQACRRVKEQARIRVAAIGEICERVGGRVDTQMREISRLRCYITATGEQLHLNNGEGVLPCRCVGCELIRGLESPGDNGE